MRKDHAAGLSNDDLALIYDVGRTTVWRIISNKVWREDAVQQH